MNGAGTQMASHVEDLQYHFMAHGYLKTKDKNAMVINKNEPTSLHDAELTNLSIDKTNSIVRMNFALENGDVWIAELSGVKAFRSMDLTLQNVVSRLLRSSRNEISSVNINYWLDWVTSLSDASSWLSDSRKQEWLNDLKSGHIELIVLEPSTGSEVAAICEKFRFV
jgi:hypothetical protein